MSWVVIAALIVLGLCLGSFINALVWRLHEQERLKHEHSKASERALKALSITKGRSMCPYCKHPLSAKDLIPVVSWLLLGGKCRYCRHRIDKDNPIPEIVTVLLFLLSYVFWPLAMTGFGLLYFSVWILFIVGFVALAVYDLRWYILPDRIIFPLIIAASFLAMAHILFFDGGLQVLLSSAYGILLASGVFFVLYQVSNGSWIGGGDVKLGIILGLLVGGPMNSIILLFISSMLGTIVSVPLMLFGKLKRNAVVPYGPFLLAAAFVVVLFEPRISSLLNSIGIGT